MEYPRMLKEVLSWEDMDVESMTDEEILKSVDPILDVILRDPNTYITLDNTGFSLLEFDKMMQFLLKIGRDIGKSLCSIDV